MSIYDRDYMRDEDDSADWWKPGYSIKRWLTIGIIAISLLTSIVFFGRSLGIGKHSPARTTSTEHRKAGLQYEKGSLRININTATVEELETLPGIGPAKAKLIVANRPYQSADEFANLQGIGKRLASDLRPFIKTDGNTEEIRLR
jgi:competence ComEA-like helix-hairpin-helix protein